MTFIPLLSLYPVSTLDLIDRSSYYFNRAQFACKWKVYMSSDVSYYRIIMYFDINLKTRKIEEKKRKKREKLDETM